MINNADRYVQQKLMEAARAVGFLEGMSTWLWTKVGPDLADEAVVEFEKRVSAIAECFGLEKESC
ncbi:hypothetical protein [Bifidobacterium ruminantium]|uniref:hypothetical protein n=1 Tax=Bifidobacterium ruminantium TaxID=78346 RepID=UPI002490EB79|nr:hypothetical protein [Bifidobacterium ruminantium]